MEDEMSNLSELFRTEVRENTLREVLIALKEAKDLEEGIKKVEEKLNNK